LERQIKDLSNDCKLSKKREEEKDAKIVELEKKLS
jgi:hypothetical protein